MGLVVNTNVSSLNAQRSLASSAVELKSAMERLSSGKKINSAADDAAGFAIAERMTAQIRGLNMAAKNASDGLSMLATIENATNDVTDMLQRIRELAVQAVNDTNGGTDRNYLQLEVDSLLSEINRVGTQTVYNNKTLLNGSLSGNIQVGTESGQNIQFSIDSIQTGDLGTKGTSASVVDEIVAATNNTVEVTIGNVAKSFTVTGSDHAALLSSMNDGLKSVGLQASDGTGIVAAAGSTATKFKLTGNTIAAMSVKVEGSASGSATNGNGSTLSSIDIKTSAAATSALATITSAIEQVAGHRASYGALQNRLEYTVSNLMNVAEFTTAARSRIEDADFAAESAKLAKAQVLQQTGTAMLAQANASSQLALQLIR
jgi:flagellin